jgi:hypothetical protein
MMRRTLLTITKLNVNKYLSFPKAKRVGNPSEERFRTSRNDRHSKADVFNRLRLVISVVALILILAACGGEKASEMFETAKFEELQNNREHATQLYEQIIVRYPNSEYAPKAKERIDALKKK